MAIIDFLGNNLMKTRLTQLENFIRHPHDVQAKVLDYLLKTASNTQYGQEFKFRNIKNYQQFQEQVPVISYDDLLPYINKILSGEKNVLWPGPLKWFAKSSGTTGTKSKLIPVSKEGLHNCHYQGGRDMLALYINNYPNAQLFSGKNLSIGGSQENNFSNKKNGFYTGNISAIVMKNLPFWAQSGRTPGLEVTMMNNWEEKVKKITEITTNQKVTSLAGSPMWMLLLLQNIIKEKNIQYIQDIWPDLEVFFHGSVSFSPYRRLFENLDKDKSLHYLEIYNATEGFFGLQDQTKDTSLLLMLNYGIFYEFIHEKDYDEKHPKVIPLSEVETGKNYSMVISTNSGLWRYKIGDTVKFTSTNPYRFLISGRSKHCINIFGEDLFTEHAEKALEAASEKTGAIIQNFTAAPFFYDQKSKGYHEWLIEFVREPNDLQEFTNTLDTELGNLNEDYFEKRKMDIAIGKPVVKVMPQGVFYSWLKQKGKLGGQHKISPLSNSREFVEELFQISSSASFEKENIEN